MHATKVSDGYYKGVEIGPIYTPLLRLIAVVDNLSYIGYHQKGLKKSENLGSVHFNLTIDNKILPCRLQCIHS